MNNDVDQYAQQKSLFGDEPAAPHPKGFREELHAREKDNIPNPNRHPGQFAPKGGSNPLLKVIEHEHGWTASAVLKDGKEFRVEGKDRREAIGNAIRAGEKMGVIFDPPAAEPKIGGLFSGSFDENAHPRETKNHDGKQAGQFAPKQQVEETPFVLQRPKKNLSVPSFGSNTNTKQSALFDVGKKNELPGQELLFNSDAGDLHNPKTMENKVATSESKSQPDPMAIAQEALSNNENIGITMGRHGVTIKGHPDYRNIRQQVSNHLADLQEQAKPQPSPARQRAMDAQIRNRVDNTADNYSHRVYGQFEEEAERYFRDYTLYDVDRYGMGGGIMKLILSMMAMHAMSSMINKQSQARQQTQKPSAAAPTTPSNQDFEKLHPRAQTQSGNSKPGQFAKKPEGQKQQSPPPPRQVRPLTERPDKKTQLSQSPPTQQQQQQQEQPAPVTPKPWLAEPGSPKPDVTAYDLDPRRGTPEQKAAAMQSRMDRDNGAPQQPIQTPSDPNTARIAEIWHGKDSGQADDFGAGVDDPPQVQPQQPQPLKTEPAAPNPRKKTLGDGITPNPAYNPQQINPPDLPAKQPRQKPEKAPKLEKAPVPEKPSLLDREVSDTGSNADIFENPAAKARREKAELDRITKFDVNEFAEPEGEEEFAGGEEFDIPAPTEEEFDTPEQLQKMQDYRARRPASEDPQELAAWRKTKPETFESATQKWNAKRYRLNSKNKKAVQDDPEENIYQVAEQNEFLPEQFKSHIDEMQRHEQGEWERREKVKSSILKAWNTDRSTLKRMENRNQDHSNLLGADQLKGSVADSDLYEFLGSDDGEWAQNAWAMVREDTPPRPGAHDKDWLNGHAENFKRMQAMPEPDTEWYPEPEDDMPFSRKSLTREIDRYFQQHLARIRATRAKTESQSWTDLDSWL